jgi:fumarate reductase subunit C
MKHSSPEGSVLSIVGALALLGSTAPRWFSVLVKYPTDQVLRDYGILALDRGSLHSYVLVGWAFEVLAVVTGVGTMAVTLYGESVVGRAKAAANVVIACGAVAFAVVVLATITFTVANPRSDGAVIGSDMRLGPGAVAAAVAAVVVVVGGVFSRRSSTS